MSATVDVFGKIVSCKIVTAEPAERREMFVVEMEVLGVDVNGLLHAIFMVGGRSSMKGV